jgi:hypothetical protein
MPNRQLANRSCALRKRRTLGELRWPSRPGIDAIRRAWTNDATARLLECVWQGYDRLRQEVINEIDASEAEDDLERSITQALEPRIRQFMSGEEPFFIQHGRYEHATRMPAPAQPPQYDLAFVLYANENLCWPLEAKVLKNDVEVGAYVRDIRDEFLTCRYAPLSAEGAMLGYLLSGSTDKAFESIEKAVPCELKAAPAFPTRPHRTSEHERTVPKGESFSKSFTCHHLMMAVG